MKSTKFVLCAIISAVVILSCAPFSYGLSHDSIIGQCSAWNRSVPVYTKAVHKQNNKWFSMFRKIELDLRFPEVNIIQTEISENGTAFHYDISLYFYIRLEN